MVPEPILIAAAETVGCEIDPISFMANVREPAVHALIQAAAGLHITTKEYRLKDVVMAPIFAPDADEETRMYRPAILAEGDQIRASCREQLTKIKPALLRLGVFKELA